jgi:signal transduction histidine kinase
VAQLDAANKQLQEIDKIKDTFLSTVSHEFRTPLASIKAYVDVLLTYDNDEETQTEFLATINSETDRLTRLINDFLDLSKIEAGRIQWASEPVEIPGIIQSAVEATEALAANTGLVMVTEIEENLPAVLSDKDRCLQVVTNLISNAIKFAPEGGNIHIRATNSVEPGEMVQVSVTDTGIGIPVEEQQRIFQKFTQVGDALKDKPPGTGLGLAICQKIVEYYNGQIWVDSQPNQGSTFSFTLPVVHEPANNPLVSG